MPVISHKSLSKIWKSHLSSLNQNQLAEYALNQANIQILWFARANARAQWDIFTSYACEIGWILGSTSKGRRTILWWSGLPSLAKCAKLISNIESSWIMLNTTLYKSPNPSNPILSYKLLEKPNNILKSSCLLLSLRKKQCRLEESKLVIFKSKIHQSPGIIQTSFMIKSRRNFI